MDVTVIVEFIVVAALVVGVVVVQSRRSGELTRTLAALARDSGWADVQSSTFIGVRVRGLWNGYAAELQRRSRQKGTPERVRVLVRLQVPARLEITRKQRGFLSGRPLAMFGPPIMDYPPAAQFWIRCDEVSLVERLFASSVPAMLDRNLATRFDFVSLRDDKLTVQRATTWNVEETRRIAREELELAQTIINVLALRP